MATLGQLKQAILSKLDDNSRFYPEGEVARALLEQLRVANLYLCYNVTELSLTVYPGTVVQAVPDNVIAVFSVSDAGRPLKRTSLAELARSQRDWYRCTTASHGRLRYWSMIGPGQLVVWPLPSSSRQLKLRCTLEPTLPSSDAGTVELPDFLTDSVVSAAAHALQLKEGGSIFAGAAAQLRDLMLDLLQSSRWNEVGRPRLELERMLPTEGG